MSNLVGSQCSSGVESGWTLYLEDDGGDGSSFSMGRARRINPGSYELGRNWKEDIDCDDDEDHLSMVSDASSGPPYYDAEGWSCHGLPRQIDKKHKKIGQQGRGRHSHYEDTACSHESNFSLPEGHSPRRLDGLNFQSGYSLMSLEDKPEHEKNQYCRDRDYFRSSGDKKAVSKKSSGNSRKLK